MEYDTLKKKQKNWTTQTHRHKLRTCASVLVKCVSLWCDLRGFLAVSLSYAALNPTFKSSNWSLTNQLVGVCAFTVKNQPLLFLPVFLPLFFLLLLLLVLLFSRSELWMGR